MKELKAADFTVEQALGEVYTCSCGRVHQTNLRDYILEIDAISKIVDLVRKYEKKHVFMVADVNTMKVAGDLIRNQFEQTDDLRLETFVFDDEELVPDDDALAALRKAGEEASAADLWLAVGSGTLNDLARFVSFERNVPYMVFATAPSMDGYASGVSPLILNRMKQTFNAQSPLAILADPEILAQAPAAMLQAGAGDVLGKYTSILDWKLSTLLFDEYYCPEIVAMVERSRELVATNVDAIRERRPEAVKLLFNALIEVGIAMDYSGNSRPASGAEHHLAHFWEMQFLFANRKPILHGLKVGVSLPYILRAYEVLANLDRDFTGTDMDIDLWREETKKAYGPAAAEVIKLSEEEGLQSVEARKHRLKQIEAKWDGVIKLAKSAPKADEIDNLYDRLSFPKSPGELGVDGDLIDLALHHAKDLRARYTVLRLFEDLGLLDALVPQIKGE